MPPRGLSRDMNCLTVSPRSGRFCRYMVSLFEGFATSPTDQWMNHGYLAVDFFYVLSGFVIGYAYDDRWRDGGMTAGRFMLRRVIRLQPMVVLSVVLGLVAFPSSGQCAVGRLCRACWHGSVVAAYGLFLIPVFPGMGPMCVATERCFLPERSGAGRCFLNT